eukprot:TRINITY_DN43157_c0_g1_i1.p1 TRINITY_DN43157_c0_g1~~TRINITY_DN43157_c0_g1_i1.p1  ORF type:complete len:1192 (-),score=153.20 TRINITY_DN43157_c0_g1_i1:2-3079(-)
MLAILWAGFAFTPVDVGNWPASRCEHVLVTVGARLVFVLDSQRQKVAGLVERVRFLPRLISLEEAEGETPATGCAGSKGSLSIYRSIRQDDLCYVIFTSGSTGRPKGVLCEHRSALCYCLGKAQVEGLRPSDRVLLGSHFTFDPCQGDIFGTLCVGATLVVESRAAVLADLQGVMRRGDVSHATMTPTQWGLRAPGQLPALRHLALDGEFMRPETVESWAEIVALRNMYGVTEATGLQSYHRLSRLSSVRIAGTAVPGFALGLAREEGVGSAAVGINVAECSDGPSGRQGSGSKFNGDCLVGEVLIGGLGLARGYLGNDEGTRRCFIRALEFPGFRVYRTGDLGRWGDCGLELLGRRDHQVKIGGVRVELSEIDGALMVSTLVTAAVCVVSRDGAIVAHVELVHGENFDWLVQAALEAAAAAQVPQQVVPRRFMAYPALPLASGGKVDRHALVAASGTTEPIAQAPFVPLATPLELAVAEAWAVVLGQPAESFGACANFLWLRGDSWSALRVCRRLQTTLSDTVVGEVNGVIESFLAEEVEAQRGEAGFLVPAEAPEGALCLLAPALGPLAPCELLARPTLREYAAFLGEHGLRPHASMCTDSTAAGSRRVSPTHHVLASVPTMASGSDASRGTAAEHALVVAARDGREAVVRALLDVGVDPDGSARGKPPRGFTPLHAAAASGVPPHITNMLLSAKANPRAMTQARTSPAHLAAARGDADILAVLLAVRGPSGPASWARDADGQTILHLAARAGALDALQCVLSRVRGLRASEGGLEARDRWDRTALQWAVANGHDVVAASLIESGAVTSAVPAEAIFKLEFSHGGGYRDRTHVALRKTAQVSSRIVALVEALPSAVSANGAALDLTEAAIFSLTVLRDLCCGARTNRELALAAGAVPRLVSLLAIRTSTGDAESSTTATKVVAAAAQTLRNLAADHDGALVVGRLDVIEALASVVATTSVDVESAAAWRAASALAQLANFRELQRPIRDVCWAVPQLELLIRRTRRLGNLEALLGERNDTAAV